MKNLVMQMERISPHITNDPARGERNPLPCKPFRKAVGNHAGAEVTAARTRLEEILSVEYRYGNISPGVLGILVDKMSKERTGGSSPDDRDF
jgi:hypothetical protein